MAPENWIHGDVNKQRQVDAAEYSGSRTVLFTMLDTIENDPLPRGWTYLAIMDKLRGTNGLEVLPFTGFEP